MAFAIANKKLCIMAAVAFGAGLLAWALFVAAPGAVAASRWLSLPGMALPGWLPLAAAVAGAALARLKEDNLSFVLFIVSLGVSAGMVMVCAAALA